MISIGWILTTLACHRERLNIILEFDDVDLNFPRQHDIEIVELYLYLSGFDSIEGTTGPILLLNSLVLSLVPILSFNGDFFLFCLICNIQVNQFFSHVKTGFPVLNMKYAATTDTT